MSDPIDKIDMNDVVTDSEAPGPPISVPDNGESSEGGKLKMIVQLLKKSLGVKDIAAMRLSLPASLLEPLPNLEYWCYLDRPDVFAAINDSSDPFERMLAVLRFTFSKELKVVHGKVCKPYNSVLGEHFRAHWDVPVAEYHPDPTKSPIFKGHTVEQNPPSPTTSKLTAPSVKSFKSFRSTQSSTSGDKTKPSPSTAPTSVEADMSNLNLSETANEDASAGSDGIVRVVFLCEQTSHHPPASTFLATCPTKHITIRGVDQIAARVSGTALRVSPGNFNKGLFIDIDGGHGEGEKYHVTHQVASINGILRGSFYVTMNESTIITSKGQKDGPSYRAVIEYKEESWIGRAAYLLEGVIHEYDPESTEHNDWVKVKQVPQDKVVAVFDGSWKGQIRWKRTTDTEYSTLIDLNILRVVPKTVRPLEKQLPDESRKLWENVTSRLLKKEFNEATKHKLQIEQAQRDLAAERKKTGKPFVPQYFVWDEETGYPSLLPAGEDVIKEEMADKESTAD